MITNLTTLYIDSSICHKIDNETSNIILNVNISPDIMQKFTHCSVNSISVPRSYYDFENVSITLVENDMETVITFKSCNYEGREDLYSDMTYYLNNATKFPDTVEYTVTDPLINADDGCYRILASDPNISKKIMITNSRTKMLLGLKDENIFANGTLLQSTIINLNPLNLLYLTSTICTSEFNQQSTGCNILTTINAAGTDCYTYIQQTYDTVANMKKYNNKSVFDFQIRDYQNNIIPLNGIDFNFSLTLFTYNTTIYDKLSIFMDLLTLKIVKTN